MASKGIIYEYEDGGRYCGEWENDAAHGHGVCTGPDGNGLFQGVWERGHQISGVFTWPSGQRYSGKWRQGVREGVGKETKKDGTEYCGEFTRDSRGAFGVLRQPNGVVFRGTWKDGVQSGLGTELYIDGGMYRGEYLNGMRHGHGTRSSSNYERSTTVETVSVNFSIDDSVENLASTLEDPSSIASSRSSSRAAADPTSNAQVYEGEWRNDTRHGYGVLKIVGHHTYYGQWEENMRSGYGVMIYGEEKRKEEGQWQRGKLVQKLKRRKLQLKSKQLEAKVNQAHMSALQAAEAARSKADLAEGRANTASAKSRLALRAAQQALKDSETAEAIEKFYRNAPKVQESAKSPITDSYSAGDIGNETLMIPGGNLLEPPKQKIPLTPSIEDLASVDRGLSSPRQESSGSNESLDEVESSSTVGVAPEAELTRRDNPSPVPWRRRTLQQAAEAKEKRDKFQSLRHSSADILLHSREQTAEGGDSRSGSLPSERNTGLKEKRSILLKIHQSSESDPTFSGIPSGGENIRCRTVSNLSTAPVRPSSSLSSLQQQGWNVGESEGELRPRHVNKATGEPDHGEGTDDDEEMSGKGTPTSLTVPEQRPPPKSVSVEVLQQMAHWNKMVAYLNLGLFFFLLILIVTVVLCMNYYWLVYQLPASPAGAGSMDFGSPRYAAGPMA